MVIVIDSVAAVLILAVLTMASLVLVVDSYNLETLVQVDHVRSSFSRSLTTPMELVYVVISEESVVVFVMAIVDGNGVSSLLLAGDHFTVITVSVSIDSMIG